MMKTMRIAAIPGDGIGKEVLPEGIRVLQAAAERWGFALSFEQMEWASCEYYSHHGKMMPDDWHEQLSRFDAMVPSAGRTPFRTIFRCGVRC